MWASAPGPANAIKRNGSNHSNVRSNRHARRPSASSSISSDSTANYYQQHNRVPSSSFDTPNYTRPLSAASSRSSGSTSLRNYARPGSSASNSSAYPATNPQWATPSAKQQRKDAKLQRKRSSKDIGRTLNAFSLVQNEANEVDQPASGSLLRGFSLDGPSFNDDVSDPDQSGDFGTVSLRATAAPSGSASDASTIRRASVSSQRSWQAFSETSTYNNNHVTRTPSRTSNNGGGSLRDFEFPMKSPGNNRSHSAASGRSTEGLSLRGAARNNDYDHCQQRSSSSMVNVVSALNKARTATGRV
jgi:hypothetical protein